MEAQVKKVPNKWLMLSLAFIGILVFQFEFSHLNYQLLMLTAKVFNGLSNDEYLMIHHFYMFILVFIPTLILHLRGKLDFGYHISKIKLGLIFLGIATIVILIVTLIKCINGMVSDFAIDTLIFQFLFSGLGEEIIYRSIPIVVFVIAFRGDTSIIIKNKIDIDFGIILSAILFAFAHVSIKILPEFSIIYNWEQLIYCLFFGIVAGYCYKKTNNIWMCMLIHGVSNLIAVGLPMIFNAF